MVRVAKIWNAKQGYIYLSYELEKWITQQCFYGDLANHFYIFCELLPISYSLSQEKRNKINTLKNKAQQAIENDNFVWIKTLFE